MNENRIAENVEQGRNDIAVLLQAILNFPKKRSTETTEQHIRRIGVDKGENILLIARLVFLMSVAGPIDPAPAFDRVSATAAEYAAGLGTGSPCEEIADVLSTALGRDLQTIHCLRAIERLRRGFADELGGRALAKLDLLQTVLEQVQTAGNEIFNNGAGKPALYTVSGLINRFVLTLPNAILIA